MSGSLGKSESESDSQSTNQFRQNVWPVQSNALAGLYNQAGNLFGQTNTGMQGQIPGATDYISGIADQAQPAWQDQMAGGAYRDMGLQGSLMGSLNQSLNNPSAMSEINAMVMGGECNNYAVAMKNQYMQDARRAKNQMLSNMDARAVASGQSGSSRHGVAQAEGMRGINENLQSNLARTGFDTFDKDLDRKLQIAGMADQGTLARQQMMSGMLGSQNQAQQYGLGQSGQMQNLGMGQFAPQMMPWQAMGNYADVIGGPTILGSGEGSMSGSSDAKGFSMAGGM